MLLSRTTLFIYSDHCRSLRSHPTTSCIQFFSLISDALHTVECTSSSEMEERGGEGGEMMEEEVIGNGTWPMSADELGLLELIHVGKISLIRVGYFKGQV